MSRMNQFFEKFIQNFDKIANTEKKRVFERLSILCTSQNIIIENLEEGIIAINTNGIIQGINKKASFLFSIPRNSEDTLLETYLINTEIGKTILELIKSKDNEDRIIKDDKNKRILQISILPLGEKGKIIGTLIKALDITESYENSQKLKRAEQLAALTTLAAGVAHEIKNPLGSISIYIQLIEKIIKNNIDKNFKFYEDINEYTNIIKEEISRLEDTINSFLFSVRKLELELKEVNINKLILDTISFLKYEIENNNINIEVKFDIENLILKIDEKYIKQSLINIIQNSIDSIIESRKEKRNILIKLKVLENNAIINIKDTGKGIEKDKLSKIFEPYFTTKRSGTGLGLTNVARIIEAHNGNINIENTKDGVSVIITLPLIQENQKFLKMD